MADARVPVLVLDVSEEEADKLLATLDPLAAMAGKDTEQLASLLKTLKDSNDALTPLVWPDYVIDPLMAANWTPPEPTDSPPGESAPPRPPALHFEVPRETATT